MIELKSISKTFNKNTVNENQLFNNFHLTLTPGEFTLMIGSNGSGKTTVLNLLAGTIFPDDGEITVGNTNVTQLKDHQRSKWIARIFQDPLAGTSSELTILENFRLAAIRTQSKKISIGTTNQFREIVKEQINFLGLGLENKTDQLMGTLSGGQRQALTLLMATMDEMQLLILDEPVAALDPKTSDVIMKLADDIIRRKKLTAIMVTHSMKNVKDYGDRLLMLKSGKIDRDLSGQAKNNVSLNELYDWFGN